MNTIEEVSTLNDEDEVIDKIADVFGGKVKWSENVNEWHKYGGAHDIIEKPEMFETFESMGQLTLEGGDGIAYTEYLIHDVVLRVWSVCQDMSYDEWEENPSDHKGHRYGSHAYSVYRLSEVPQFNEKNILDFDSDNYTVVDELDDWVAMWGWETGFGNAADDVAELLMENAYPPTTDRDVQVQYAKSFLNGLFTNAAVKMNYDMYLLCNSHSQRNVFQNMAEDFLHDVKAILRHKAFLKKEVA